MITPSDIANELAKSGNIEEQLVTLIDAVLRLDALEQERVMTSIRASTALREFRISRGGS